MYDIPTVSTLDYDELVDAVLSFDASDLGSCVTVTIIDDLMDEPTESFNITLDRSPGLDGRIILRPVEGVIEINDNDGTHNIVRISISVNAMIYSL